MAKKFIPLVLDKTRNIRYGMVALTRIEKKLGKPFASINFGGTKVEKVICPDCSHEVEVEIADGGIGITYAEIADILWAGMVHEDTELTSEKVAELIDEYSDIATAMGAMSDAMQEAFGTKNVQGTVQVTVENGTGILPSETPSSVGSCPTSSGN